MDLAIRLAKTSLLKQSDRPRKNGNASRASTPSPLQVRIRTEFPFFLAGPVMGKAGSTCHVSALTRCFSNRCV